MAATLTAAPRRAPGSPVVRACWVVSGALVASGLLHLVVALLADRPFGGPLSFRKPATFGLSFGTTLAAVTWVAGLLVLAPRTRSLLLGVLAVDCVVEVSGITVQAWRDRPSHFDTETPFDRSVAMLLAAGGGVLVVVLGALAVTAFCGRVDGPPSMRLALRAGFALLLAGLGAGVAMIVRGTVLVQSGHRQAAYDTAGFLKLFHAVTLHAVLVLPALAALLARAGVPEPERLRLVRLGTAAYVVVAGAVLVVQVLVLLLAR
ncbi:hypothetical protein EV189_1404 [Motilibacter rhizosphaerae]|uniref:Uncharacterized protein n=1 Tax=Motilibacter rhizosphaerae TaxID=598652 RepID=A0A4Q7NRM7_9ACTN|nr:hypothetical protein [Motilibacter rhizosphaerae]RZS89635.1 hypothetical protein EV189_1404 [Motilibacter rhizosphaerae]